MHPLQSAYDFLMEKLNTLNRDVSATKKLLNELARGMDVEQPFPNNEQEATVGAGVSIKIDEFVNKPPSTALQEYLAKRGKDHGAVTWQAVVDVFKGGGFDFSKFGGEKAVRMTLIKNTTAFKFLRKQNAFGLKSWYGSEQKPKKKDDAADPVGDNMEGSTKKKRGRPKKGAEVDSLESPKA